MRTGSEVARDWVRAIEGSRRLAGVPGNTLAAVVAAVAEHQPDAPALLGEAESFTYGELAARANRYAHWALDQGMPPGCVVALLMPNRPEYVAAWLGLTQVGCVVALLNTNLSGDALTHCIGSASAGHVIVDAALAAQAQASVAALPGVRWWPASGLVDGLPAGAVQPRPAPDGRALLIYTSGTTGLPKAANVSHARVLEWSGWFAGMMDARPTDRLFNCLPLYHSTGGVVAVGAMLVAGGSVVIRERFSASRFWADVATTRCTVFQYIGELCRYLLNAEPGADEAAHELRLCCGNGLGGEVWPAFQERFRIPRILEFYAATEGGLSLYNCEAKPGAIGRVPAFLAHRFPLALLRCDEAGEPLRDADGRCVRCAPDEPGEAVALLDGTRHFDGYTDAAASARKLLRGVFADGDCWFRTGDLMRRDAAGFYAFVDRLGETYRWKGENVATTEVAAAVLACPGVMDAAVYGVAVPGAEGKAGMAAIVVARGFDLGVLREHLAARLPAYARPLFVRVCRELEKTGTFKLNKTRLAREGFAAGDDPVWLDDREAGSYVVVATEMRARIAAGVMRL